MVTEVQFGHFFLVCIKHDALITLPLGYSEIYHTIVS